MHCVRPRTRVGDGTWTECIFENTCKHYTHTNASSSAHSEWIGCVRCASDCAAAAAAATNDNDDAAAAAATLCFMYYSVIIGRLMRNAVVHVLRTNTRLYFCLYVFFKVKYYGILCFAIWPPACFIGFRTVEHY